MIRPGIVPGILLILFGLLVGFERTDAITFVFQHFWSLAIFIPCMTDIRRNQPTRANTIGCGIGLSLLATTHLASLSGLLGPLVLMIIGIVHLSIPHHTMK